MMVNFKTCLVAIFSLTLTALPFAGSTPTPRAAQAPYIEHDDPVPGSYIVLFNQGHSLEDHFSAVGQRFEVREFNSDFLPGYYAENVPDALREKVREDPGVSSVDENYFGDPIDDNADVECSEQSNLVDIAGIVSGTLLGQNLGTSEVQDNAGWALSYLSSATKNPSPLNYAHIDNAGQGVDVYVIDSGIAHDATEFGNRAVDELDNSDEGFADSKGHGTKVASMIGGSRFGVSLDL